MINSHYDLNDKYFVKDVLEQAIDGTYHSSYWGQNGYSKALYKMMMDFGGGIMTDAEMYYKGDLKAFNKSMDAMENVVDKMNKGFEFSELRQLTAFKEIISPLEQEVDGLHKFVYHMSNASYRGEKEVEEQGLVKLKKALKRIIREKSEYAKKIHYIHKNKKRIAIRLIFTN